MTVLPYPLADDGLPLRRVFLLPGSLYVATAPAVITTILGSCIAVCLWDRARHISGMNHFVLPLSTEPGEQSLRYGDVSIDQLVKNMRDTGSRIKDLRAKLFGGASVLSFGSAQKTVGARNLDVALDRLHDYDIPVLAKRTGGRHGLLLRLNTLSGGVGLRPVSLGRMSDVPPRHSPDDRPRTSHRNLCA